METRTISRGIPEAKGAAGGKKRALTQARREQNRAAQKIYRERQKKLREDLRSQQRRDTARPLQAELQPKKDDRIMIPGSIAADLPFIEKRRRRGCGELLTPAAAMADEQRHQEMEVVNVIGREFPSLDHGILDFLGMDLMVGDPFQVGPLTNRTVLQNGLPNIDMGNTSIEYDDSPCLFDTDATREQQNEPSTIIPSRPVILTPFDRSSNTSAISSSSTSPSRACPSIPSPSFFLADPYANARSLSQTAIFTALLHNALSLGFDLAALADCGNPYACLSPFYSATATAQDDPRRLVADALARATPMATTAVVPPISLRPTLAQILVPHHTSLDLIPFPQFRDRVILLSAALPHQFNLMELKKDIYVSGALRVAAFANDDGSAVCGRQSRQPWEPRSWEVRGWFLKKWSLAINSDSTEMA